MHDLVRGLTLSIEEPRAFSSGVLVSHGVQLFGEYGRATEKLGGTNLVSKSSPGEVKHHVPRQRQSLGVYQR